MLENTNVTYRIRSVVNKGSNSKNRVGTVNDGVEYSHKVWYDGCMFAFDTKICFEL